MRTIILLLSMTLLFTPLVSAKQKGDIKLLCDKGCKISLDNEYKGQPKRRKKSFVIENVPYGNHIIRYTLKSKLTDTIHITLSDALLVVDVSQIAFERNVTDIKPGTKSIKIKYDRIKYKNIMKLEADTTIMEFGEPFSDSGGYESMPIMIKDFPPEFPEKLRKTGKSGVVWIRALVGPDGNVLKAEVGKNLNLKNLIIRHV